MPRLGRAATMIRSAGCRPAVILSSSVNPVSTPVTSVLRLADFLDVLIDLTDERIDRREAGAELPHREFEDGLLDILEDLAGRLLVLVAPRHDFIGYVDHAPQGRFFLYDWA